MRDDLISRKALVDSLETGKDKVYEGKTIFEVMNEIISEQETAFDKEKVIAELKNEIELVVHDPMIAGRYIKKDRAVKIVEKGGIQ